MRYQPYTGWREHVYAMTDTLFLTHLGPELMFSAQAYCPVFGSHNSTASETSISIAISLGRPLIGGALRDSIHFYLRGHTLVVRATGDEGDQGTPPRYYAYWVETGHRIVVFGYDTGRNKEPQPFLRPALLQVRGAA